MNPNARFPALISMLMMMATATLGWMSLRPGGLTPLAEMRSTGQVAGDAQDIPARLWEDPLQAIQPEIVKAAAGKGDDGKGLEELQKAVEEELRERRVFLLVVPLPESPFPGDQEVRLRTRYSIQMALTVKNYMPNNRNYLGYFRLPAESEKTKQKGTYGQPAAGEVVGEWIREWAGGKKKPEEAGGMYVPYEWFRRGQGEGEECSALVLWLPEIHLRREPLHKLQVLCTELGLENCQKNYKGTFMIGPRTSEALKSLIPGKSYKPAQCGSLTNRFCIFSPQATAPDDVLGLRGTESDGDAKRNARGLLRQAFRTAFARDSAVEENWEYFYNFTPTDDRLTGLLVNELRLRSVKLDPPGEGGDCGERDKVLILAEADSTYGTALVDLIKKSIFGEGYKVEERDSPLHIYRYLRGLDQQRGQQTAEKPGPAKTTAKAPEELLAEVLSKKGAPAHGESQLDYVDRIAADLERWDQQGRKEGRVRAVGVLGADIYDKLILLRTLRRKFPEAVFFTTDLDARLWHPDHIDFTRNLIVASGYGVEVPRDYRKTSIPPFRDTYQVATFHACQAALMKGEDRAVEIEPSLTPRVFEIGRNGATELGKNGEKAKLLQRAESLALIAVAAVAVLFFCAANKACRERHPWLNRVEPLIGRKQYYIGWLAVGAVALVVAADVVMRLLSRLENGEPWVVDQGISIWPTEVVRVAVILGVVVAVFYAQNQAEAVDGKLGEKYHLHVKDECGGEAAEAGDKPGVKVREEYRKCQEKARLKSRAWWITLWAMVYMFLGLLAMKILEGEMPFRGHVRGAVAQSVDMACLLVSILSYTWLLVYVLHTVWINSRLFKSLGGEDTLWPRELVKKEMEETGAVEDDLRWWLDVKFVAEKSKETGRLIVLPFAAQLLFIISRNSHIDHWTWPATLVGIFIFNFTMAYVAWSILRRSARRVKDEAEEHLQKSIDRMRLGRMPEPEPAKGMVNEEKAAMAKRAKEKAGKEEKERGRGRLRSLLYLQKKVQGETRGAYARFFQDPALLATFVPTGIVGILVVLFRVFFGWG